MPCFVSSSSCKRKRKQKFLAKFKLARHLGSKRTSFDLLVLKPEYAFTKTRASTFKTRVSIWCWSECENKMLDFELVLFCFPKFYSETRTKASMLVFYPIQILLMELEDTLPHPPLPIQTFRLICIIADV